ncbi:hypothetical protein C440_08067 [Haloferax mucosum ATCC BAA-1512]|uniref:Uncharacterized protein n=1 Tax=Haloferax mucosum ATCC BAA-1512 TaxID=662479 RepID=M0IE49_9EURY|nr:transcriptional regulator [Haloferax mucosum]ELZ95016.1 hypothetical protein C440_08067 [Haloferax mucosum ATCC BAA-1512]
MTKLKVIVGKWSTLDECTRQRIKATQEDEGIEDAHPILNFESYAELSRLFSPKNLRLLEAIATDSPQSIHEATELVNRDYKQVHRNLTELEDIGIIEFECGEPGLPKKPVLPYDGLEIHLPFDNSNNNVGAEAP